MSAASSGIGGNVAPAIWPAPKASIGLSVLNWLPLLNLSHPPSRGLSKIGARFCLPAINNASPAGYKILRVEWMEYKQFIVTVFEPQPGKWCARVRRRSGRALIATGRTKMDEFVISADANSASKAMIMAMDAIDAGAFSRKTSRSTEKFWRRQK